MATTRRKLRDRAGELRRDSTAAEQRLWQQLRNRKVFTRRFRRQQPIGPYITDFCCLEGRLVVELNEGQHRARHDYDAERTKYLEAAATPSCDSGTRRCRRGSRWWWR